MVDKNSFCKEKTRAYSCLTLLTLLKIAKLTSYQVYFISLSLSLSHAHTHMHPHWHTHGHRAYTPSLYIHIFPLSHTHKHSHHTRTYPFSLYISLSFIVIPFLFLFFSLSLSICSFFQWWLANSNRKVICFESATVHFFRRSVFRKRFQGLLLPEDVCGCNPVISWKSDCINQLFKTKFCHFKNSY